MTVRKSVRRFSYLTLCCLPVLGAPVLTLLSTQVQAAADNAQQRQTLERLTVHGQRQQDTFGSKSGILLQELPQSVQLLDVSSLRAEGLLSVGELLRQVPSANAGYSRVGPYQSFSLKIRGFMADQMRNGMRQRYFEDVDASALAGIERLEVLKGPSGVLYGQSAVGGVINLVSKMPDAAGSGSASLRFGSFAQKTFSAEHSLSLGEQVAVRVGAELERSDTFVDQQGMDRNNFALTLQHQLGERATGVLVAEHVKRKTNRYAGLPVSVVLPAQQQDVLARSLQLGEPDFTGLESFAPLLQYWLDLRFSEQWTLTPRLQYSQFNTVFGQVNLRTPLAGQPQLISRNGRQGREDDAYYLAQLDLTGTAELLGVTHHLLLGYEGGWERGRFTQWNIRPGSLAPVDVRAPVYQYSGQAPVLDFAFDNAYNLDSDAWYWQDQLRLSEQLQLIAAARHTRSKAGSGSWHTDFALVPVSATIWQLGLNWQVSPHWALFTGHNTGFDLESSAGARSRSGQPLQPEESAQQELGVRFSAEHGNASLALFRIARLNALTVDPLDADFRVNDAEQRVQGLELEGSWQLTSRLMLQGGYAWMSGEVRQTNDGNLGARLGDLARHQLNLSASWQFNEQWSSYVRANYASGRPLTTGALWQLDGYRLLATGLRYQQSGWSAQLALTNVLDEHYFTASGNGFVVYPGEPRQASLQLQWHW